MSQSIRNAKEMAHRIIEQSGGPSASFGRISTEFEQLIASDGIPDEVPNNETCIDCFLADTWIEVVRLQMAALVPADAAMCGVAICWYLDSIRPNRGDR